MTALNLSPKISTTGLASVIDVPLFDPPYKLWDNGPAIRNLNNDASYLCYNNNGGFGDGYRQAILTPTKLTTWMNGTFQNPSGTWPFIHFGANVVSMVPQGGQNYTWIQQNILLPGGPSVDYLAGTYPFTLQWQQGNFNQGWGRQFFGPLFRTWFNSQVYIGNIGTTQANIYMTPFNNPTKLPLIGNAPSATLNNVFQGSFQFPATSIYRHTLFFIQTSSGTAYVMPVTYDNSGNFQQFSAFQIVTDNAAINSAILSTGAYNFSFGDYGLLIWWASGGSNPTPIPGQQYQAMLIAFDPTSMFPNSTYALMRFHPQTSTAAQAVTVGAAGGSKMKIDANGIFYYDPGVNFNFGGYTGSYIANSFGLDISIPGIGTPLQPLNNGIPLQTFCPCSPVAIGRH